jgi:peptide/nickel transport system permease protein
VGGYFLRRVAWAVAQLVAATIVLFTLFFIAPGADLSVSSGYVTGHGEGRVGRFQETGSAPAEYVRFLGHVVHGEFGRSLRNHQDVGFLISRAWPATASLVFGGLLLWLLISLVVGVWSAFRPRSLVDRLGTMLVLFGVSAHPLVLSLVLAWLFGYKLQWLPLFGYCDMFHPSFGAGCGGPVQWAYHLILPWFVVGAAFGALYTRMIRSTLLETMQEDFVRTARAKGLSEWTVLRRHTLRAAMLPLATILTMDVGVAFGGTMFVERVFHIPGLGQLLIFSVARPDLPVILGVMVIVSVVVLLLSLLVDLICVFADPRITVVPPRPRRRRVSARRERPVEPEPVPQAR